jgi:FkbM family methyltransferase
MEAKEALKSVVRRTGFEIRHVQPNLQDFFRTRAIDTVLDVGANVGGFASSIRGSGYTGKIISFEPIADVYERLQLTFADDPLWIGYMTGISNESGEAVIGVSEYNVFSSLHALAPSVLDFDKRAKFTRKETIKLMTLDQLADEIVGDRIFLKIDTQGHEKACLEGLGRLTRRIKGMQLELPLSAHYLDTWDLGEAISFIKALGFIPCQFSAVNYHKSDPIAMVQLDCVFRRYDPTID